MPGQLLHLAVAEKVICAVRPLDYSQYYLGGIAPDAIHAFEDAPRSKRIVSHLMSDDVPMHISDNIETRKAVIKLYNETDIYTALGSFTQGYCIHILTDIFWLKTVYTDFLAKDGIRDLPTSDADAIYYNEMERLSYELCRNADWLPEVWTHIENARAPDNFFNLTAAEIERWRDRTLHWYDEYDKQFTKPARYISLESIEMFIQLAEKEIKSITDKYKSS